MTSQIDNLCLVITRQGLQWCAFYGRKILQLTLVECESRKYGPKTISCHLQITIFLSKCAKFLLSDVGVSQQNVRLRLAFDLLSCTVDILTYFRHSDTATRRHFEYNPCNQTRWVQFSHKWFSDAGKHFMNVGLIRCFQMISTHSRR